MTPKAKSIKMSAALAGVNAKGRDFDAYGIRYNSQGRREVFATGPLAPVIDQNMQTYFKLTLVGLKMLFAFFSIDVLLTSFYDDSWVNGRKKVQENATNS